MPAPALNAPDSMLFVPESHQFAARMKGPIWIGLATALLSLAAAGDDDPVDDVSDQNVLPARQQLEFRWLTSWTANDAVAAAREFDLIQRERIAIVNQFCGLTASQNERLQLARHLTLRGLNERLSDAAAADLKRALPMLEIHW